MSGRGLTRKQAEAIADRVTVHRSTRGDYWFVLGDLKQGGFHLEDVPLYAMREGDVSARMLGDIVRLPTEEKARARLVDDLLSGTVVVDADSRLRGPKRRAHRAAGSARGLLPIEYGDAADAFYYRSEPGKIHYQIDVPKEVPGVGTVVRCQICGAKWVATKSRGQYAFRQIAAGNGLCEQRT